MPSELEWRWQYTKNCLHSCTYAYICCYIVNALKAFQEDLSPLTSIFKCQRKIRKGTETKLPKCTNSNSLCGSESLVDSNSLLIFAAHKSIIIKSIKRRTEDNLETRFVCHHDNDKQCIKSRYIGWYFQYQIEIRRGLAERKPISMLLLWISLGLGGSQSGFLLF